MFDMTIEFRKGRGKNSKIIIVELFRFGTLGAKPNNHFIFQN
jgi:hypothetical protein